MIESFPRSGAAQLTENRCQPRAASRLNQNRLLNHRFGFAADLAR
jgi:hypothetical protein